MSGRSLSWVWEQEMPPQQKLLMAFFADHSTEEWVTYLNPDLKRLVQVTGLSRATVTRTLRSLEDDGWLLVDRNRDERTKRQQSNVYRINYARLQRAESHSEHRVAEPSLTVSTGRIRAESQGETHTRAHAHAVDSLVLTKQDSASPSGDGQSLVGVSPGVRTMVDRVWQAHLVSTGKNGNYVLDGKRKKAVETALKTYPLAEVMDAVVGWRHDPWEKRVNYNDVTILLKDAASIEKYRDLERQAKPRPTLPVGITPPGNTTTSYVAALNARRAAEKRL